MAGVILVDSINTLLGQPPSYMEDPATANELNDFMRIFVSLGMWPFMISSLFYIAGSVFAASILPRRLAYLFVLAMILGHYFGASTWLVYHWELGMQAAIIYGIIIATIAVCCGIPQQENPENRK